MSPLPSVDRTRLEFRDLADTDDLGSFTCQVDGVPPDPSLADLDDFLRDDALRLAKQQVARTVVAVMEGSIVGYVAMLADAVTFKRNELKKAHLEHDDPQNIPALKVGRLAVAASVRGQYRGVGTELMRFAYDQALLMNDIAACRLLTVDAYHAAREFYVKLKFVDNTHNRYAYPKVTDGLCDECPKRAPATDEAQVERRTYPMRLDLCAEVVPEWAQGADDAPPDSAETSTGPAVPPSPPG